jgi:multidrug efflux pump subunit AcrB
MGGIVGRLFREFAVTLSVAILISLVVSLTTTPMMCAYIAARPRQREGQGRSRWYAASDGVFQAMLGFYDRTLTQALRFPAVVLLILFLAVGLNVYLFVLIPKGLFPQQDTGRMIGGIQADQSISFQLMRRKLTQFITIIREDPAVDSVVGFTGGGQTNSGFVFVARPGVKQDGGKFIADAVRAGAVAVVAAPGSGAVGAPVFETTDPALAGARLVERFHGDPSSRLDVVGITGTNGKTTTSFLTHALLAAAGRKTALVTTVLIDDGALREKAVMTTPGAGQVSATFGGGVVP